MRNDVANNDHKWFSSNNCDDKVIFDDGDVGINILKLINNSSS